MHKMKKSAKKYLTNEVKSSKIIKLSERASAYHEVQVEKFFKKSKKRY